MKRNIYYFNNLLRIYNKYRRKLANLRYANKNERRQHILQNHIERLQEKLTVLKMSIKTTTVAASMAMGVLGFLPQNANAQSFAPKQINPFSLTGVYNESAPTFADLDGDGDYDMLVGSDYSTYNYTTYTSEYLFKYYENVGTAANPVFASPQDNPFGITSANTNGELAPTFVDIDNDGDMDIIYGNYYSPMYYFLENTGTSTSPSFAAAQINPFGLVDHNGSSSYSSVISFADLDNDGDLDMISGDYYGDFYYFENTGTASAPAFAAPQSNPFGITSYIGRSAPTFIDIDGDGDFDLLSGAGNGNFFYYENTGTTSSPTFGAPSTNPFNLTFVGNYSYVGRSKPTFVDLDNDGDLDLMAGDGSGDFNYYKRCTPTSSTMAQTSVCNFISPSGQILTASGTYTDVITNATGCDSVITINLTINPVLNQPLVSTSPIVCGTSGSTTVSLVSSQSGVSYYLRDDSNDAVIDGPVSGTGAGISFNTGVISSPTTYNVYGERIVNSKGLMFDGADVDNKKVDCGNATSVQLSGSQITLEAWVYPTQWKGAVWGGNIINKEGSGDLGYMLRCGDNGRVNFNIGNGSWNELTTSSNALVLNSWQHVAASYDGSTMEIFVNGNLVASQNSSISFSAPNSNLTIGNWSNGGGRAFIGSIDEARVWSVAKTQADILANMNSCLSGSETGLAAYYQFEDGTSSLTLTDLTVNGNDGILQNMDANTAWGMGAAVCSSCNLEMSQLATVTFAQPTSSTISPTACNSYTSPSGNYTWTSSGSYTDIIPNFAGCDSVITVNLTISPVDITIDNSLSPVLSANQVSATYQWVDCNNGNAPISGETSQTYTATSSGSFAVEITYGGCTVLSACESVIITSINEQSNIASLIYPNPTNGIVNINISGNNSIVDYVITTIDGRTIDFGRTSEKTITIDLRKEVNGIYFLKLITDKTISVSKLNKQ